MTSLNPTIENSEQLASAPVCARIRQRWSRYLEETKLRRIPLALRLYDRS